MSFAPKPKPYGGRRRNMRVGRIAAPEQKVRELDDIAVRHITSHPEYELIVESLREGLTVAEISRHFAQEQLLNVTEKTFGMYLYVFRKRERARWATGPAENQINSVDRWVRGDQPGLDTDREMDRAIRFQKIRVGIGHNHERTLGMPMKIVSEDMKVLGSLIELKAKRQGMNSLTKIAATNNQPLEKTVEEKLKVVQRDQEDHNALYRMASDLVESAASKT